MKARTLNLLAALGSPLIVAGSASAGFTGIHVVAVPNPYGVNVMRVYAEFDNPGQDHLLSVVGVPGSPLRVRVTNGTFYNHPFGSDQAPNENIIAAFPSLAYDTFVSIGRLTQPDATQLSKDWPGFPDTCLVGTSLGWSVTAADPQSVTTDDRQGAPVDGVVFIGQFSSESGSIAAWFLLEGISDGEGFQAYSIACHLGGCMSADFNNDKCVDILDFLRVLDLWGPTSTCEGDLDGDGFVGMTELLVVLAEWDDICFPCK